MKFRTMAAAVAALSLTAAPAMAESVGRAAAPMTEQSEVGGSSLLLVLAVVLFGAGIFFLVDNEDDDPDSP